MRAIRWLLAASIVAAAAAMPSPVTAAAAGPAPLPVGVPPDGVGGQAVAWGADVSDPFAVPASLSGQTTVAVSAGIDHDLALTSDGTITGWGYGGGTVVPDSLTGRTVTAIAAGYSYSLALTSDGTITAWGANYAGILSPPSALAGKTVTAIAAGEDFHALALTSSGQVYAWGENYAGQTDVPASLTGRRVVAIAAGGTFSAALTADGQVVAWGDDRYGETDVPASLTGRTVTALAAGSTQSVAVTADGRVTTWGGTGANGLLDVPASLDGRTVVAVAAGAGASLALTSDGDVVGWGDDYYGETDIPASLIGRAHAIALGNGNALAIATPGPDYVAPVVTVSRYRYQRKTTDPTGEVIDYATPTAVDAVDGPVPVTCAPPAGSRFPVGGTRVVCSATDSAGNIGHGYLFVLIHLEPTRIEVASVSPASGPSAGGTVVTLTGHGFTGAKYVGFGNVHTTDFTVESDTRMTVVAPPSSPYYRAGFVHVFVHGRGTSVGFVYDRYHYLPEVTSLSPSNGPAGTTVTITGDGFTNARTVTFSGTPATSFTVVSDTEVTAVVPALPAGPVDVRVTVPGGTTPIVAADRYTAT